ncbi:MAG: thiamine pyrophosphate-dependent dehydrogenase E1 component subunit alpha [Ferrimicrobium sp.]
MFEGETMFPLIQRLDEEGTLVGELGALSVDDLVEIYQEMRFLRTFDERAWNLQRQGVIGTYAPYKGQEATQLGAVAPLLDGDWVVPTYRDWAACYHRGVSLVHGLFFAKGHPGTGDIPRDKRVLPAQVVIAAQTLHAVGVSWATKLRNEGVATVAFFGDGATSQGDFHEAMNFGSVLRLPLIFMCENNQWAISVPLSSQMRAQTIAQRSVAYGIEGYRVDGNDYVAVYNLVHELAIRARAGEGPFLVEAITYRLGAHTTADDPGKYRSTEEYDVWVKRDPLTRLERFLTAQGRLSETESAAIQVRSDEMVEGVLADFQDALSISPRIMFDNVYEEMPAALIAQQGLFDARVKELGA